MMKPISPWYPIYSLGIMVAVGFAAFAVVSLVPVPPSILITLVPADDGPYCQTIRINQGTHGIDGRVFIAGDDRGAEMVAVADADVNGVARVYLTKGVTYYYKAEHAGCKPTEWVRFTAGDCGWAEAEGED